jgi:hypothetical protein
VRLHRSVHPRRARRRRASRLRRAACRLTLRRFDAPFAVQLTKCGAEPSCRASMAHRPCTALPVSPATDPPRTSCLCNIAGEPIQRSTLGAGFSAGIRSWLTGKYIEEFFVQGSATGSKLGTNHDRTLYVATLRLHGCVRGVA